MLENLYLGLDIGSVNARTAVVNEKGQLIYLDRERLLGGPDKAVAALIKRLGEEIDPAQIVGAGVVGSGRQIYEGQEGWNAFSSPYAAITGVRWDHPDAKTIIAIGGQSSLVIGIDESSWRVARSPLCAAGSGRFIEQQAQRLGISIEEFGLKALEWVKAPPRIAARCSVFAKSDLIHLQQKGWPVEAMTAGLCDAVSRMVVAQWRNKFEPPVYVIGGVASNQGVVQAFSAEIDKEVIVPSNPAEREAIGTALLARKALKRPASLLPPEIKSSGFYVVSQQLKPYHSSDGWHPAELIRGEIRDTYVGVDVGSTSTKAVIISPTGEVLFKSYLMTAGQPLEAVKQVMRNLIDAEPYIQVKGVGVTGSGRYLVGNFIGASLIKNEITAQTKAAIHLDPQVTTIFELGGQDAKYVRIDKGIALDSQMNKACAAGTGSFVDELSDQLGISTRTGDFASLAFSAERQIDLGEKCAAFMSQAVTAALHEGIGLDVIVSSLAISLAKNYHSKVVGTRRVGDRIFLTGAVFYNEAVVSAFEVEFPGKTFIVPQHKEVTGAIGVALLAKETMLNKSWSFKGFTNIADAEYKLNNFTCHRCENRCVISMMTAGGGQKFFYGSRCDFYDATRNGEEKGKGKIEVLTPFNLREELLFGKLKGRK